MLCHKQKSFVEKINRGIQVMYTQAIACILQHAFSTKRFSEESPFAEYRMDGQI